MKQALLLVVGLSAVFGCQSPGAQSPAEQRFTFTPVPIGEKTQLSCRALTSLNIGQNEIPGVTGGSTDANRLSATIVKGTDRLSIRIEPDYLVFLSRASFEIGRAEGSKFPIMENTPHYLKAVESFTVGVALLESFVLNKQSGLAIWTKIQAAGLLNARVPYSQTIYLACL